MKKIISFILALALCLPLTACGPRYEKYSGYFTEAFDTFTQVISYRQSREEFDEMLEYTETRYKQLHKLYDIYNSYENVNNIKTINDNAGIAPVKVDKEIIDLLLFSKEWHEKSGGKMNVAMGSVLKVWHDKREEYDDIQRINFPLVESVSGDEIALPDINLLKEKALHTDINLVEIDTENMTVFIKDEKVRLDVGAVAKGFATELVADELIAMGYDNFLISAGGNVKSWGAPKDERTRWGVSIENPMVDENWIMLGGSVDTAYFNTEMSLVCSGGYQRFMIIDNQRYHHLIDPVSLCPEERWRGVAILCEDSGMADALSTTVFMMNPREALRFVEEIEGADCILTEPDGTTHISSGAKAYLASRGITSRTK